MELNEYQKKAMSTCMPSCENFSYMFLNLVGEVGEFASKIAKAIRKEHLNIGCNDIIAGIHFDEYAENLEQNRSDLKAECGDILWQLSSLCQVMGWSLEEVAEQNLAKLASRKSRNLIDGSGDNR